jgi:hypothetical protein
LKVAPDAYELHYDLGLARKLKGRYRRSGLRARGRCAAQPQFS